MDKFEVYMFEKITKYKTMYEESKDDKNIGWAMNNCLEELIEVFAEYTLNCKI